MIARASFFLSLVWLAQPAQAAADDALAVHLTPSDCDSLPFAFDRLRGALELELSVESVRLVDEPEAADVRVSVGPERCEPGASEYVITLDRGDGVVTVRASLASIPLAIVVRALALGIAEAVLDRAPVEVPRVLASPAPSATSIANSTPTPIPTPAERPATRSSARESERPVRPAFVLGAAATFFNTPDSGGALGGLRAFLDLALGRDLPLGLRADVFVAGGSSNDLPLAAIGGGLTIAIEASAADVLDVRFGPRLWLGHAFALGAPGAQRLTGDVQIGVAIAVALELRLASDLQLGLGGEVGAHLIDLEYARTDGPAGLIGAFWALDVGLAWSLPSP